MIRHARAKARSASSRQVTRASIVLQAIALFSMDCRVKPANDTSFFEREPSNAG
jgi:hypothetical protein